MRKLFVAALVAFMPLSAAASLSGCVTLEQLQPKSPRNALAEAELMFVGVIDVTGTLAQRGILKPEETQRLLNTYMTISRALDMAHVLLAAGDTVNAEKTIAETLATLSAVALQLSLLAEANAPKPAGPPPPAADPVRFDT